MIAAIRSAWSRPWLRRTATILFLLLVTLLIAKQASMVAWDEVVRSIQDYQGKTLLLAASLACASYLIYSCFDLLGRRYTGAKLSTRSVMTAAFVSYAFNQSIGSLVGAVAFRFRLYTHLGLDALTISKIIMLSVVTNWFGYSVIAGLIFAGGWISLPGWEIGQGLLRLIGVLMIGTAGVYLALCKFSRRRQFSVKGQLVTVPGIKLAMAQLFLSVIHWPVAAMIIYVLLHGQIDFITVLGALLLSAIAAVLAHIPAGVGVLEAIFLGLLSRRMPSTEILAALMVFRALYYLGPLTMATIIYMAIEARARKSAKNQAAIPEPTPQQKHAMAGASLPRV